MRVRSGDAEIFYEVLGAGPDVVLLHAFPVNHEMWLPAARLLASKYRVILPDLRGHGDSGAGHGPATMEKHAADILRVCDDAGVSQAVFAGVSIGGYILFESWRRQTHPSQNRAWVGHPPERVRGLIFCDTRAQADTDEACATRLQSVEDVHKNGPAAFLDSMVAKQLSPNTVAHRADVVAAMRKMMSKMTPAGIAAVQRGMAARPDSRATLATINVPTLVIVGAEDTLTPVADAEAIRQGIAGSSSAVLPLAAHLAVLEQHEAAAEVIANFLDTLNPKA
jgi:pimeloyl-ACP methyl ester carboxylesterase